jgi:hypothetical protein
MRSEQRELIDGLGLCLLALGFGALFVYGAFAVAGDGKYVRAAIYGVLGLAGLAWGIRMTRDELARYREQRGR